MRLLALLAVLMLPGAAHALENVTPTIDSVSSTETVRGIDISSAPATDIVLSTAVLYRQVCVQNLDTSNFLACSDNVNVSTQTSSNGVGTLIAPAPLATAPATPMCFSIVAGTKYYCRTSSVTGTTRAGITRGR